MRISPYFWLKDRKVTNKTDMNHSCGRRDGPKCTEDAARRRGNTDTEQAAGPALQAVTPVTSNKCNQNSYINEDLSIFASIHNLLSAKSTAGV